MHAQKQEKLSGKWGNLSRVLMLVAAVGLGACSTAAPNGDAEEPGYYDPFESSNRAVFAFNDALDRTIAEPVARGYRAAVPSPARQGVRNVLRNLRSPVNIANQALQGDIEGFANDTMRMLVNTTFGIGGLFDIANEAGLEYEAEDFGQTLAVWGVGHGPYFVAPVFGPNSLRDHTGNFVDAVADPLRWYLFNTDREGWAWGRTAVGFVDKREELLDILTDLRKGSIDYYAAMRSAQYQHREAAVVDRDEKYGLAPAIPDYDSDE